MDRGNSKDFEGIKNKGSNLECQELFYSLLFCLKSNLEAGNTKGIKKYIGGLNGLTKYLIERNFKLEAENHHLYKRLTGLEKANTDLITANFKASLKNKEIYSDVRDRVDKLFQEYNDLDDQI